MVAMSVVAAALLTGCGQKDTDNKVTNNDNNDAAVEANNVNTVTNGDTVKVWYVGRTTEDGVVFDTNIVEEAKAAETYDERRPYATLDFEVGAGMMIPGFDKGVVGMETGEKKTITISAEDGYGQIRDDLKQTFTRAQIEQDVGDAGQVATMWENWIEGETYNLGGRPGTVLSKTDEEITFDLNHFLAGKELEFEVEIEEIVKPEAAPAVDMNEGEDDEETAEENEETAEEEMNDENGEEAANE